MIFFTKKTTAKDPAGHPALGNVLGRTAGFTMIELMVSIAIFAVISGVVLYNYSEFNTNILIGNLAYNVALSIRQAQIYGVAVQERVINSEADFTGTYGVYFSSDTNGDGTSNTNGTGSYTFFSDLPDPDPSKNPTDTCSGHMPDHYDSCDEAIEVVPLANRYYFKRFCAVQSAVVGGGTTHQTDCSDGGKNGGEKIYGMTVTFARPEPDARIHTIRMANGSNIQDGSPLADRSYVSAYICIASPLGKARKILVEQTGQISVVQNAGSAAAANQGQADCDN